jgi:hypothetical protein
MSKEEKKRKGIGALITFLFHTLIVVILFAFTISPEEKIEDPVIIMFDFSGASAKGGSSASKSESKSEEQAASDPIKTQQEESPVTKTSSKTKSTNKSSKNTPKVNSKATAGSRTFGNNNGTGTGNNDGDGEAQGNGEGVGPGLKGKTGTIGDRSVRMPTNIPNPSGEEGTVAVEITVLPSGEIYSVKVLASHARTTTNNPQHLSDAKKIAKQIKYSADGNAKEYEKDIKFIKFEVK